MKKFTVTTKQNLKEFTDNNYLQGSFVFSRLLKQKDIKINNVKTDKNVSLKIGDEVCYYTTEKDEKLKAYDIIFEDDNILIADKFSGVNSEGLFNTLSQIYKGLYFVHRLDRNTCGLIVFAKNEQTFNELIASFKQENIEKIYNALCFGTFVEKEKTLTDYLFKNEKTSLVKIYKNKITGSVKIETKYKVLQSFGEYSLVEVIIHNGKTHQIRAHLSFNKTPIVGDEKYGDSFLNKKYKSARQCLLAKQLIFNTDGCLKYLKGKSFISKQVLKLNNN